MNGNFDFSKITSDEAFNLLEDIPSDGSDVSESEDEVEDMDLKLDDLDGHDDISDVHEDILDKNNNFESEDELPLNFFVGRKEVKWTADPNNATTPLGFSEIVGPNVPDDLEYHLNFFFVFV